MLIRFKKNDGTEYPQWEEKRLGEICKVFAGGTPSTDKSEYWGTDILWIQSGLVQNCTIKPEDIKTSISKLGLLKSSAKMIKPNSVLLAMTGATCGNIGYLTCDACANQSVMAFEPLNDNAKFLYYLLIKNRNYILNYQAGGAQAGVNKKSCTTFVLDFPCLEEQQKIADFLSTVDQKIEAQKAIVADYEELKKGTMQKIFNQEIRFKDDEGNEFPEWEEKRLDACCDLITKGTTPKVYSDKTEDINFIKIESIENGIIRSKKCAKISKETHEKELKRSILKENDILFAIAGSLGISAIVNSDILPANTNQALAILRLKENVLIQYIYTILNSTIMGNYIKNCCTVGAQPNLSLKQMNEFKFSYPCLEEQKKIADCLSALDRKIEAEKKILADLEELKKGLLQAIFNN